MKRGLAVGVAALALVGVSAVWLWPKAVAPPPPNVLIVLWDTVRADRLTPYNPRAQTTPNLAVWAEQAVVFEHAVSAGMWTVPSHASMFTGLPASSHGVGIEHLWLDGRFDTVAEWLGGNGYATYAFSANPNLSPNRLNLLQGFDRVDVSWQGRWRQIALKNGRAKVHPDDASTEISPRYGGEAPAAFEPQSMTWDAGPATQAAFVSWLEKRPDDRPWLAYLSYMEAHKPRIPSMAGRRAVSKDPDLALQFSTDLSFDSQLLYSYRQKEYNRDELNAVRQVYDATLWDLDRSTAALFAQLEAKGELENTIVVFTSDHGEQLGEHHLFGHRNAVYQTLLHVPLIVSWPGHLLPERRITPVSTIDLFQTLVKLTGVPSPEGPRSKGSWLDGLPGTWGVLTEALDIDGAGYDRVKRLSPGAVTNPWNRTFDALVDGRWKLMLASDGETRLHDLAEDPHEWRDRAEAQPDRVAAMKARLAELKASMPPYDPGAAGASDVPVEDDATTKEYLGVLGYIDEEDEP